MNYKFKFKDKTAEEIGNSIIVENNFEKTMSNLKNVVLLMHFESKEIMKQKTKKYILSNFFVNIKEAVNFDKKIKIIIDKVITSQHLSKKQFLEYLKSAKFENANY